MAAGHSLPMSRRRRADEEGEDEEGPVMVEDSQSEGSPLSEMGSEGDADHATQSDVAASDIVSGGTQAGTRQAILSSGEGASLKPRKAKKRSTKRSGRGDATADPAQTQSGEFKPLADTEAMMKGLKIGSDDGPQDVVDYATMDRHGSLATGRQFSSPGPAASNGGNLIQNADKSRREQDMAKTKRDGNLNPVSNRGAYFMHDTRASNGPGAGFARGAWNGRGRGKGLAHASRPFSPANHSLPTERAAGQQWKHDLHDTINEEPAASAQGRLGYTDAEREASARLFPKPANLSSDMHSALSFSTTTLVGKVSIRVFIQGMKDAVVFADIPWKHYTRLPDHRPPLRRDKPVRISIPNRPQRYIFPALERSFIFIPRQMRPNQQGFGRTSYQRNSVGFGASSRRTSAYGGSIYAGSVAASRRSSFASVARDHAFSPAGSYAGSMPPTRPIVRLPHGAQPHFSHVSSPRGPLSGQQTPTGFGVHTFPLPQQPIHQAFTPTTTVHQPRPQKTISVTGIESPAVLQQAEMQPFQNQLPAHLHEQAPYMQPTQSFYSPRQQYGFAQQVQAATPLSGIPEQASQAGPFQPQMPYSQPAFYAPYAPQSGYYYPGAYQAMPMYAPVQQGYMAPSAGPIMGSGPGMLPNQPSESEHQPSGQQQENVSSQSGMVAQEHNGMVFYLPASEAQQQSSSGENTFQPAESFVPSYAMPGLPPPTPAPDAAYYYPSVPQAMYYPVQGGT